MTRNTLIALTAMAALSACANQAPLSGQWQAGSGEGKTSLLLKDGNLSATAGCNRLFGPAEVKDGRLLVGNLASTMMMCPPELMQKEDALKKLLASKPQVEVKDGKLLLKGDSQSLVLEAAPSLEGGKTRFIYVMGETKPCMGVAPMQCLQVREDKAQPWQNHFGQIEGFKAEPGLNYRLRIKEFDIANPPADAPSKRWVLDMVVESEVVKP
ncbi:DUF4377 domain-containing protein [Craterilacuibacter sp.]|uniref:DUF4377 domain-containing protein n=1 Tax=Craterilacuibacter sp. TaxID=2870909 RepID=UPI003F3DC00C